jgi:hypothetical protein
MLGKPIDPSIAIEEASVEAGSIVEEELIKQVSQLKKILAESLREGGWS